MKDMASLRRHWKATMISAMHYVEQISDEELEEYIPEPLEYQEAEEVCREEAAVLEGI